LNDQELFALAVKNWEEELQTLTEEQIKEGFLKARKTLDYPPSIAQFKKLALDLPSVTQAFTAAEAGHPKFRNLIISWDWKNLSRKELQEKFRGAYEVYQENKLNMNNNQLLENKGE